MPPGTMPPGTMPPGTMPPGTTGVPLFSAIPMRVIAMTPKEFSDVRDPLVAAGFTNPISHFQAIRGADMRAKLMADPTAISPRAVYEIEEASAREAHSSMPSWGGVGCYLSHEALWRESAASSTGVIIMEADCRPVEGAKAGAEKVFAQTSALLGRPPELLWFGFIYTHEQKSEIGLKDAVRVTDRVLGAHAYFVSPAGAKALLSRSRPIEVQVDSYTGYMTKLLGPQKLSAFVPVRSLFIQRNERGTTIQLKRVEDILGSPSQPTQPFLLAVAFLLFLVVAVFLVLALRVRGGFD